MSTTAIEIGTARLARRKFVKEPEIERCVKIHCPFVENSDKTYTHEEVFKSAENVLNNYFGTNLKLNI